MLRRLAYSYSLIGIFIYIFLSQRTVTFAAEANFALSPASGSYNVNETFDVNILLNAAGGKIGGADVYLTFDQNKINLLEIENGTIFGQYAGKTINNINGSAAISGLADGVEVAFTGSDTFARLRFKALSAGATEVKFNFTPGSTRDTNAIDFDTLGDILTSVTNGSYTISGPAGTSSGPIAQGPTVTKAMPITANELPTLIVLLSGIILISFGVIIKRNSI